VTDFLQAHPDGVIAAMDEMSLYVQATTTRVWFPRGQTPIVWVHPQRASLHYYGALALLSGQEFALTLPALTSDNTAHFLGHFLSCVPARPILLLLDRASWHTGPAIRALLAAEPRLELAFFPPACPDLNPQEHVWKLARDTVSHNHSFTESGTLRRAFSHYLDTTVFQFDWLVKYAPATLCHV